MMRVRVGAGMQIKLSMAKWKGVDMLEEGQCCESILDGVVGVGGVSVRVASTREGCELRLVDLVQGPF